MKCSVRTRNAPKGALFWVDGSLVRSLDEASCFALELGPGRGTVALQGAELVVGQHVG